MFNIILAIDENFGIGYNNTIPWKSKNNMQYFKNTTKRHILIVGRKTWNSMPQKNILKDRNVIVVSKTLFNGNTCITDSLNNALCIANEYRFKDQEVFVIGGAMLYKEAFQHSELKDVHLSRVKGTYQCDTYADFINIGKFKHVDNIVYDDCEIFRYITQPLS